MGSSKKCVCTDGGPECTAGGCAQGVRPNVRKRNDDEWGTKDSRDGYVRAGAMVAFGRLRFSAKLILEAKKKFAVSGYFCVAALRCVRFCHGPREWECFADKKKKYADGQTWGNSNKCGHQYGEENTPSQKLQTFGSCVARRL